MVMTAEEKKAKKKAYLEANKDKIALRQRAYRETNKDKITASQKAWYEANRGKILASQKAWYEANKDRFKGRVKSYDKARRITEERKAYLKSYYKTDKYKKLHYKAAKAYREKLGDVLVSNSLRQYTNLKPEDVTPELIEAKRLLMLINRRLR